MKEIYIKLEFDKADTRLAGNPLGKQVYKNQVEHQIDYNCKNIIEFPNHIEKIASSFTQGFFSELVKNIGFVGIEKIIKIRARNEKLEKDMMEDLLK